MKVLYTHCHLLELAAVSKTMPTSKVSLWTEFLLVHRHFCCQSMKWMCHVSKCFCEPWNICKIKDPQNIFSTQNTLFEQMPSPHFTYYPGSYIGNFHIQMTPSAYHLGVLLVNFCGFINMHTQNH